MRKVLLATVLIGLSVPAMAYTSLYDCKQHAANVGGLWRWDRDGNCEYTGAQNYDELHAIEKAQWNRMVKQRQAEEAEQIRQMGHPAYNCAVVYCGGSIMPLTGYSGGVASGGDFITHTPMAH